MKAALCEVQITLMTINVENLICPGRQLSGWLWSYKQKCGSTP